LFKTDIKLIFHVFSEKLVHAAMVHERQGARKKFVLPIESLFFTFFFFAHGFVCHLQCDRYDLNVKFLIFFKKFYMVHSVEVLSQDPCQQKEL
jgi:hypothetical protein